MQCRMVELRCKEVINICDGCRIGYVGDVEVLRNAPMNMIAAGIGDTLGKYVSLCDWEIGQMITGEYYCPWECIKQIGDDIILVDKPVQRRPPYKRPRRKGAF